MKKKTVVIGASLNPNRYSHRAIIRLNSQKHSIVAIGLKRGSVGDVNIITFEDATNQAESLSNSIDTITLYLNPKRQKEYYQLISDLSPRRVIFNPGTENPELYDILKKEGIQIEVACTLVMLATGVY